MLEHYYLRQGLIKRISLSRLLLSRLYCVNVINEDK